MAVAPSETMLCSACAMRNSGPSGFCDACLLERRAEDFGREDHRMAELRRSQWGARTQGDQYAKLRRQRKRLVDAVRPHRVDPGGDPWIIAAAAITALTRMRGGDPVAVEAAVEALRRLAWGPD